MILIYQFPLFFQYRDFRDLNGDFGAGDTDIAILMDLSVLAGDIALLWFSRIRWEIILSRFFFYS